MPFELNEIKQVRKKLGLTQTELAKHANVSQSLIAKIESGRIDPTYSKTKRIFDTLNELSKKHELNAEEIMQKRIISVEPNEAIKEAINKMKKYEISQMPVIKEHKCVGVVSEGGILDALINKEVKCVKEIMEECPPIVSKKTSMSVISNLLKFYPIILVSEDGKLIGVITKSDIITTIK
jgi:predicted transcriptional regulator